GEVAELSHVHTQHGDALGRDEVDGPQHRAVTAEADREVAAVGEHALVDRALVALDQPRIRGGKSHFMTAVVEPGERLGGKGCGLVPLVMQDEGHGGHYESALRTCTRNSTLPSAPFSGDSIVPMMVAPRSTNAPHTSARARSRTPGSRITPRPREASARPASNWGFTSSTRSAPGRAQSRSAGATVRKEMNDRCATTTSTGPPITPGSRPRTLVRSCTSTRSSARSRSCSWP